MQKTASRKMKLKLRKLPSKASPPPKKQKFPNIASVRKLEGNEDLYFDDKYLPKSPLNYRKSNHAVQDLFNRTVTQPPPK
jgi:hypothetical protein